MTARTPWDLIKPWLGPMLLLAGVGIILYEVFIPKYYGQAQLLTGIGVGLFGAWLCDPPGADSFVTLVLRVVPWYPRTSGQQPPPPQAAGNEVTVHVPVNREVIPSGSPGEAAAQIESAIGPVSKVTDDNEAGRG